MDKIKALLTCDGTGVLNKAKYLCELVNNDVVTKEVLEIVRDYYKTLKHSNPDKAASEWLKTVSV
jgi:hypothetical protein